MNRNNQAIEATVQSLQDTTEVLLDTQENVQRSTSNHQPKEIVMKHKTVATENSVDAFQPPTDVPSQPFISDDNFQLLKESQRRISQGTGISPAIRIILNRLISKDQLVKVESSLIEQLKQIGNA